MISSRRIRVAVVVLGSISQDTGARTYLANLLEALIPHADLDITLHLSDEKFAAPAGCAVQMHRVPAVAGPVARVAAEQLVGLRLHPHCVDVVLAPFNFAPLTWRGRVVLIEHNVLAVNPQHVTTLRRLYRPRAVSWSLGRATRIVAVSQYLRDLLVAAHPSIDPSRISVVYPGVSQALLRGDGTPWREPRALNATFLCVGALWPYKRLDQAVRALAVVREVFPKAQLIIAGPAPLRERRSLEALASTCGVDTAVNFAGHLNHSSLRDLYLRASALLFLSEIESLGLPVLEAMALGLPVVARRIPAIAEIAGEAPVWVHVGADTAEIAEAMVEVLREPRPETRRALGLQLSSKFTWEAAGASISQEIRHACAADPAIGRIGLGQACAGSVAADADAT